MRGRFDRELDHLHGKLIDMGKMVEAAIENSITALLEMDDGLAKEIMDNDDSINHMEKEIESICLNIILKQHPVASDLRLVSAALKMITDMERIGDQAADIAEISLSLEGEKFIKPISHIPQMAELAIWMVSNSLKAFVNGDLDLADRVINTDEQVNSLFDKVKYELIDLILENPINGGQALDLLMIAKYLERIGDHAENIAEWVIFSITGINPSLRN